MKCLRCGVEIPDGESFCANCLEYMEKEPIPADVHVMLPKPSAPRRTTVWKQNLSADEKLAAANVRLRRARFAIAVLLLLVAALSGLTAWLFLRESGPALGQNYSTVSPPAASGTLPTESQ